MSAESKAYLRALLAKATKHLHDAKAIIQDFERVSKEIGQLVETKPDTDGQNDLGIVGHVEAESLKSFAKC